MAAESETGGERTEEPSSKRLQDARERGQVPRSRELTNLATALGGSATLIAIGGSLSARMMEVMRHGLTIDPSGLSDPGTMMAALGEACVSGLIGVLPLFGAVVGLVFLASVVLGGWNFSMQALGADFSRMSPLAGITRLFGLHGITELGKALMKCLVIGGVCAAIIASSFHDIMDLAHMEPRAAIGRAVSLLSWDFVWLCSSLALIAMIDVPLQLFQFHRSMRMTRQELRDEAKESDGRPETKQRIRRLQQQLARRRMMQEVPTADVVIVNPTHFAVALKYDPKKMRAPRVVAKGGDLIAQNIRRIATENRVPIFESPKLARALFRSTDLDAEIPAGLYAAVAQVLSYIFRVRSMNPTLGARVTRPEPTVSDEYETE